MILLRLIKGWAIRGCIKYLGVEVQMEAVGRQEAHIIDRTLDTRQAQGIPEVEMETE